MVECRGQIVLLVAGVTGGRQALELAGSGAGVALLAVSQRMCPDQRKSILVIPDCVQGDLPAADGVALFAVGAHLAAMQVGMAVGALLAHIGENEAGMAGRATQLLVHPAQRIAGVIVVKLGSCTDWLPTRAAMAVFARDCQRAVRIGHLRTRVRRGRTLLAQLLLPGHACKQGQHSYPDS